MSPMAAPTATSTAPAPTLYVVQRPFEAMGHRREAGEVVDAADWRTVKSLVALRYLAPAPAGAKVTEPHNTRTTLDLADLDLDDELDPADDEEPTPAGDAIPAPSPDSP